MLETKVLAQLLQNKSQTVATAESCTGGLIGAEFTSFSGSSHWYRGGIIAYANSVKEKSLAVEPSVLSEFGAVSEQTARQMAEGVIAAIGSSWGISVTGIAGPEGGTPEKPVGLVYIATSGLGKTVVTKNIFIGDRDSVRSQTVRIAILQLTEMITS